MFYSLPLDLHAVRKAKDIIILITTILTLFKRELKYFLEIFSHGYVVFDLFYFYFAVNAFS